MMEFLMAKRAYIDAILNRYRTELSELFDEMAEELRAASAPKKKTTKPKPTNPKARGSYTVGELKLAKMANLFCKAQKNPTLAFKKIETTPAYMVSKHYDGLLDEEVEQYLRLAEERGWTLEDLTDKVMTAFSAWQLEPAEV